jgi:hypothetical protein
MQFEDVITHARALKETAEVMVKAGNIGPVEATTRSTAEALVEVAKKFRADNPVLAVLTVRPAITWPEVLTIANAVYMS